MSDGRCLSHALSMANDLESKGLHPLCVHGTITNNGKSFKHAWVELPKEKLALDPTINVNLPIKTYYSTFSPREVIKMEPFTATMLQSRELHFATKSEVIAVEKRIKLLDAQMAAKRKMKK